MKRDSRKLLHDILTAAGKIMHYTINLDHNNWFEDEKTQQAVERNFEIIGEAIKRLSQHDPELVARIPDHD